MSQSWLWLIRAQHPPTTTPRHVSSVHQGPAWAQDGAHGLWTAGSITHLNETNAPIIIHVSIWNKSGLRTLRYFPSAEQNVLHVKSEISEILIFQPGVHHCRGNGKILRCSYLQIRQDVFPDNKLHKLQSWTQRQVTFKKKDYMIPWSFVNVNPIKNGNLKSTAHTK